MRSMIHRQRLLPILELLPGVSLIAASALFALLWRTYDYGGDGWSRDVEVVAMTVALGHLAGGLGWLASGRLAGFAAVFVGRLLLVPMFFVAFFLMVSWCDIDSVEPCENTFTEGLLALLVIDAIAILASVLSAVVLARRISHEEMAHG
jgi:hypothetical protein